MITESYTVFEDVVSRQNQDGTVIVMKMDEENTFYKLTHISARFWIALTKNENLQNVIESVLEEFNVSVEQLEVDLRRLLDKLILKNLIKKI